MIFGDSITAGEGASMWFSAANRMAGYPAGAHTNAGIGGNTTAQMLARISTDVVAHSPTLTVVEGGGNDVTQGRSAAQIIADLESIYAILSAAGSKIIATTVLPSVYMDAPSEQSVIVAVNAWMRATVPSMPGVWLCDWNPAMTDGVSEWAPHAGYTYDGVHPDAVGGAVMADQLWPVLLSASSTT